MAKDEYHYKLLKLWTDCVDLPGYNKRSWQFLSSTMDRAISHNDDGASKKLVLLLAKLYLQAHIDGTLDRS